MEPAEVSFDDAMANCAALSDVAACPSQLLTVAAIPGMFETVPALKDDETLYRIDGKGSADRSLFIQQSDSSPITDYLGWGDNPTHPQLPTNAEPGPALDVKTLTVRFSIETITGTIRNDRLWPYVCQSCSGERK